MVLSLLRSDPLVPLPPFFMVEVVDSLAELSKICSHTNRIRSRKLLLETKLDPLVSSIPATSRGVDGVDEETLPLAK
jgi:hypothetical protein